MKDEDFGRYVNWWPSQRNSGLTDNESNLIIIQKDKNG